MTESQLRAETKFLNSIDNLRPSPESTAGLFKDNKAQTQLFETIRNTLEREKEIIKAFKNKEKKILSIQKAHITKSNQLINKSKTLSPLELARRQQKLISERKRINFDLISDTRVRLFQIKIRLNILQKTLKKLSRISILLATNIKPFQKLDSVLDQQATKIQSNLKEISLRGIENIQKKSRKPTKRGAPKKITKKPIKDLRNIFAGLDKRVFG